MFATRRTQVLRSTLSLAALAAGLCATNAHAGLRLGVLPGCLDLRETAGRTVPCGTDLAKGAEMGWFEHGSTIVVLAPAGFALWPGLREGARLRMGEPLMRLGAAGAAA